MDDINGESRLVVGDGFVYTATEYENGRVIYREAYYADYAEASDDPTFTEMTTRGQSGRSLKSTMAYSLI